VEVDAVEVGDVSVFGADVGAEVIDRVVGDAGLQPARHGAGRHAADHLAVHQLVAGAEDLGEAGDDRGVALDEVQPVVEGFEQVAAGLGVDAGVLRVGVELGL
jgi:hypothetical protein